jgi:pimeloyl-ACP methyl ester carboxylesterase
LKKLPVLFIPGTLCTPAVFGSQIQELELLASRVDVVQFAFEDSISRMADTAIKLISTQSGAAVIGFSMGGMVAMEIIRKAPKLIKKLALLNTNFHADLPERKSARMTHLNLARSEGMERVIRQFYLERYFFQQTARTTRLIIDMSTDMGTNCFEAQIKALTNRQDSSVTLPAINCPTLIIGAEQDDLCPPSVQLQMHRMINHSKLLMLENCGHFSMLEQPRELNKALRNWYQ